MAGEDTGQDRGGASRSLRAISSGQLGMISRKGREILSKGHGYMNQDFVRGKWQRMHKEVKTGN